MATGHVRGILLSPLSVRFLCSPYICPRRGLVMVDVPGAPPPSKYPVSALLIVKMVTRYHLPISTWLRLHYAEYFFEWA